MLTCPICRTAVLPNEPGAIVVTGDHVQVIHLAPCGALLLELDKVGRLARIAALLALGEPSDTLHL